jgi:hypothetical protein
MKRLVVYTSLVWLCACQPNEPTPLTEVIVQISADEQVQQAGDTLIVEISSGVSANKLSPGEPETYNLSASTFSWPVTITLVAKASHEAYVFELNLRLEKDGKVLTRGRVQSRFVKGRTLVLQTSLSAECLGKLDCPQDETCVVNDGQPSCESAAVDPDDLPTEIPTKDAGTSTLDAGQANDAGETNDSGEGDDAAASDAGSCTPLGAEDCLNGLDDDCNGAVDCADSECQSVTQCVPDSLAFVLVSSEEECPRGYEPLDVVHQDLKDNGCAGCSCEPNAKQCEAYVRIYTSLLSCQRDRESTGGVMLSDPAGSSCSAPVGKQLDLPMGGYGFNVNVTAGKDSCDALGDAKLSEPQWGVTLKRCSARLQVGGCAIGHCAPRPDAKDLCWPEAEAGCGAVGQARTYYQGYDDTRSCEPCSCTAQGGSCSDVGATLTVDKSCRTTGTVLRHGETSCEAVSADAMVRLTGRPHQPQCSSGSIQHGTLLATGSVNLCCGGL